MKFEKDSRGNTWLIGEVLGNGAFGTIYTCCRTDMPEIRGVFKEIPKKQILDVEAAIHRKLSMNGVAVPDYYGRSDNGYFMERYTCSLEDFLKRKGKPRTTGQFTRLLRTTLNALMDMADLKILHRDIKPENILVKGSSWNDAKFVLADFGLIHVFEDDQVAFDVGAGTAGTMNYLSAECEMGFGQSVRNDLIALGFTMTRLFMPDLPWVEAENYLQKQAFRLVYRRLATLPPMLKEYFDEVYRHTAFSQRFNRGGFERVLASQSGVPANAPLIPPKLVHPSRPSTPPRRT